MTIDKIAQICNVSNATVSRALNNSGYIAEATKSHILDTCKKFDYIPSNAARSLSTQKSQVIGVLCPEVSNPFFAEVFEGLSEIADLKGYQLIYINTKNDARKEQHAMKILQSHSVEGIILTPAVGNFKSQDKEYSNILLKSLTMLDIPVVFIDREIENSKFDGIFSNDLEASYQLVTELIQNGHKNIATITGDLNLKIGQDRFKGYKKALKEHNIQIQDEFIFEGNFSFQAGYDYASEIYKNKNITALFTPNNLTTLGVLRFFTENQITIPGNISLVAFDDIELLNILGIKITSLHRKSLDIGKKAMTLLLKKIKGEGDCSSVKEIIMPDVILRGSEKFNRTKGG